MTINLEATETANLDIGNWTALQAEICMNVANAKIQAFAGEADRAAEYVRLGFLTRPAAADYLHVTAIYNQLYAEYGREKIQGIIAEAFKVAA